MKHLTIALLILCFAGCSPQKTKTEWKSQPEYRAFISTRMAEAIMNTPVVIDDEEVEELCDGSGWIVHGDGHKTPCPGCDACESKGQAPEIEWSGESIQVNEILKEFEIKKQEDEPVVEEIISSTNKKGPLKRLFSK